MKNLLSRTKSGRRKGSLGLVLDSDAAEEALSTNGAAAAPAPADAVEDANHDGQDGARRDAHAVLARQRLVRLGGRARAAVIKTFANTGVRAALLRARPPSHPAAP